VFRQLPAPNEPDPRRNSVERRQVHRVDYPPVNPDYADIGSAEMPGLLEYVRVIARRKGLLIGFAAVGALAAILYALPQKPIYQAQTTIEIQSLNTDFLNIRQMNPVVDNGDGYNYSDVQTQMKILQSDALITAVLNRLKIMKPSDTPAGISAAGAWRKILRLQEPSPEEARKEAMQTAAQGVHIRNVGQTRILEITTDSTDAQTAADFVNTLVTEFQAQNMESRAEALQRTSQWLTRQLEEMKVKLERSEDELQSYARKSGLMFTADKNTVSEERLRQIQSSLSTAQADRIAKQTRYEMATNNPAESLPDVLRDSTLSDYKSKIDELRRKIAELKLTFKDNYPKVQAAKLQLTELEATADRERKVILRRIKNEYEEAQAKEKLLERDYAEQARTVTQEAEKAVHYGILKREVDSNRQVYDAVLQRVKEASLISAMRTSNVRVIDPGAPPSAPYKPKTSRYAIVGTLGGLAFGIAFILIADRANRALKNPGDAQYYLNTNELGVIPSQRSILRKERPSVSGNGTRARLLKPEEDGKALELQTWRQSSLLAESFRVTLTSILFSGQNGNRPRSLVITSPGPGEGKSTVISNLAVALAEINQRVLLVDADTRRPRVHEIFGLTNDRGLVTLLQSNKPLAEYDLGSLVQRSKIPSLDILCAGPPTPGSTNLLYSEYLSDVVEWFENVYDMVLIDSPPMLQMPDARVIGRVAGGVVLVVRSGKTTRDAAAAAVQKLSQDGTRLLGTILNDWETEGSNGYYGYGYGAYDRYYANQEKS
jgi:capsular exopolysaccharide synthesis family protein